MDAKAPRMRKAQFSQQVVSKDLYKRFKKEFPEHDISWLEFSSAWADIAETIREESIYNPLGVKLGSYTGELKLQYIPYKFSVEEYTTSKELGEKINHANLLTKGKVAKIKWERRWAVKRNKMLQFFGFEATRKMANIAKIYTDANPDKIRVNRSIKDGRSIWRKL